MLSLGKQTRWGKVGAIAVLNGERYYFLASPATSRLVSCVSMLPAMVVESGQGVKQLHPEGEVASHE